MSAPTPMIDSAALHDLLCSPTPPRVLDVRTPGEFETVHIAGTHNVPLDLLREYCDDMTARLGGDVVLVCRSGQRASQAAEALRTAGVGGATVLHGGIIAWEAGGFAVNRGAERWDLERQVRLVAGSIVLSSIPGSALAPRLKWLAAVVGGGLTTAALTNTCAMGMLLSRLPNNRGAVCDAKAVMAGLARAPRTCPA